MESSISIFKLSKSYNGLKDYVDANRNDYITTHYSIFFSDYNLPYTHMVFQKMLF